MGLQGSKACSVPAGHHTRLLSRVLSVPGSSRLMQQHAKKTRKKYQVYEELWPTLVSGFLGSTIHHSVCVQNGQHHVGVAIQNWYMRCVLQCHANAMLSCSTACSEPEQWRHATHQRKCPSQGNLKKKGQKCIGHGCSWQEYMSVRATVHIAPSEKTVCDTCQGFKVLTDKRKSGCQ